ncbi:N2,N2-dimethylguanosine tRNA methyltransferase-domain-containing protein [Chaetomium strumarium]|uniref:tRNA (guanine(26)-N(2))-dimethyltransferase n=1 Tax=Chaetomium strumarium TaxID=1170767 RepID=A0AAJ0GWL9_9PEZI|nr:N2,N2-dimethylguanosine tRNA methyltransferase-domain-containing protein [Chaetomium strumarium]
MRPSSLLATSLYRIPGYFVSIRTMSDGIADLSATPAEGQRIKHNNVVYTTVKEGLAHILIPADSAKPGESVQQVFYNPIQQFNRDLTVLAIKAYGKERMQQKQAAIKARSGKFAEKKRKRKEQVQGERPAKSPKLSGTEAESIEQADIQMQDGTEEQTAEKPTDAEQLESAPAERQTEASTDDGKVKEITSTFTILDALSASGLRALRYAREIPFATTVTANDILKAAAEAIERNAAHNKLSNKISVSIDDALAHMYGVVVRELRKIALGKGKPGPSEKYDVIDLDPYGSAAPFLDAAVQAVRDDGGLLCVTCTDSGVWASNGYPEKCYALYGGIPIKGWYSHEVGIRLILHAIESSAAKYGLSMEPLLSLSVDFYSRVFVRIRKSPSMVKFQGGKNMVLYSCGQGCGSWTTQLLMKNKPAPNKKGSGIFYKHGFAGAPTAGRSCEHCGSTMHLAGPMYAGRIHSAEFIKSVIAEVEEASKEVYGTKDRMRGTLTEAQAAAIDPYPFYFHPAQVSGILHCASPPENALRGALIGLGYRVTRSHCKPGSMKTDAPWSIIWHIFREWIRQKAPIKEENIKPGSVAFRLLGLGKKAAQSPRPEEPASAVDDKEADPAEGSQSNGQAVENGKDKVPEVVFDETLGRLQEKTKYVRYQMNPRENWGPMNRAKGK